MKIITAQHMGLCFGVKDAIQLAEDSAKTAPTTILGPLAHNESIQKRLKNQGIGFVQRPGEATTQKLVITAHGVANSTLEAVRRSGFDMTDATCPLVQFAHRSLDGLVAEGYYPVIIGKKDHIEVRGMTGDLNACTIVLESADISQIPNKKRIGIVSQTTQPMDRVLALVREIQSAFPKADVCFKDTVCRPTKQRQEAAVELGQRADVVVVIGGKQSNNTRQLSETIARSCPRVHQITQADELNRAWFQPNDTVGVTAGTSTPDAVIQPVLDRLEQWALSMKRPAPKQDTTVLVK